MDGRIVCRVMIYSYKGLEKKCELIDNAIYNMAVRSAFKNTTETYKGIERLIAEKISYINTKVIIDKAFATLKSKYELEQYHIKGVSIEKLTEALNTNRNTIEHRLCRQRAKLYESILNVYSGEELLEIICDSEWLMKRYTKELKNEPKTGKNIKG